MLQQMQSLRPNNLCSSSLLVGCFQVQNEKEMNYLWLTDLDGCVVVFVLFELRTYSLVDLTLKSGKFENSF